MHRDRADLLATTIELLTPSLRKIGHRYGGATVLTPAASAAFVGMLLMADGDFALAILLWALLLSIFGFCVFKRGS